VTRPSLKLTVAALLGTLAYLGVAILGWGGIGAFFAEPARIDHSVISPGFPLVPSPPGRGLG
jgi:hypothetical protein